MNLDVGREEGVFRSRNLVGGLLVSARRGTRKLGKQTRTVLITALDYFSFLTTETVRRTLDDLPGGANGAITANLELVVVDALDLLVFRPTRQ